MYWHLWLAAGLLFLIIEIVTPGFLFLSFGIGAILTGLLSRIFPGLPAQLVIFSITTLISFLMMKRFESFMLKNEEQPLSNVDALVNKTGIVTRIIEPQTKGYVKIGGEEWSAISENSGDIIPEGTTVKILRVEGNKVIVTK